MCGRIGAILDSIISHFSKLDDVTQTIEYQESLKFRSSWEVEHSGDSPPDFEWVYEQAISQHEKLQDNFDRLDDKADSVIKLLGSGTGLFAFGLILNVPKGGVGSSLLFWCIPAVALALISIWYAVRCRLPKDIGAIPKIRNAVMYVQRFGKRSKETYLGEIDLANEHLQQVNMLKAQYVSRSNICYWLAIALLGLPLIAIAFGFVQR